MLMFLGKEGATLHILYISDSSSSSLDTHTNRQRVGQHHWLPLLSSAPLQDPPVLLSSERLCESESEEECESERGRMSVRMRVRVRG